MNRSILIVICDFLVLSAMSLSMGVTEIAGVGGKGMTGDSRPAVTHKMLMEQLQKEFDRHILVEAEKEQAVAALAKLQEYLKDTEQKLGASNADLAKVRAELQRRGAEIAAQKSELTIKAQEVSSLEKQLKSSADNLQEKESDLAKTKASLSMTAEELKKAEVALLLKAKDLQLAENSIAHQKETLKLAEARAIQKEAELQKQQKINQAATAQLAQKEAAVRKAEHLLEIESMKREQAQISLSGASAEVSKYKKALAAKEADLWESDLQVAKKNAQLEVSTQQLAQANAALAEREKKLVQAEVDLKKAQADVALMTNKAIEEKQKAAAARIELMNTNKKLAATEQDLAKSKIAEEAAKAGLAQAEAALRSDALSAYSKACREVRLQLKNDRLINQFSIDQNYYIPEITFDGKVYLPCGFMNITGIQVQNTGFTKVTQLAYSAKTPELNEKSTALNGPIQLSDRDSRICLFPIDKPQGIPLPIITAGELKKRGLQDLTLFKSRAFGKESAELNGRVSISLNPKNVDQLTIRNTKRKSSELPAEIGDFVISKEGRFVGVIVAKSEIDNGSWEEAECFLFRDKESFGKQLIPLTMDKRTGLYSGFADAVEKTRQKIRSGNL